LHALGSRDTAGISGKPADRKSAEADAGSQGYYVSTRPHRSRGLRRTAGAGRRIGCNIDDLNRGANKADSESRSRIRTDVLG
jgi:hypothetical protein